MPGALGCPAPSLSCCKLQPLVLGDVSLPPLSLESPWIAQTHKTITLLTSPPDSVVCCMHYEIAFKNASLQLARHPGREQALCRVTACSLCVNTICMFFLGVDCCLLPLNFDRVRL